MKRCSLCLSALLLVSACSGKPTPPNGDPTATAGAGGGAIGGAANAGAGMSGSAGAVAGGGVGGNAQGGVGGHAQGAMGGEAGTGTGGGGETSSGGMGGAEGGMGGDPAGGTGGEPQLPETRCPEGPFPVPEVESTTSVCQNFDFNYNYNEGPTWISSENAFFFTNFRVARATGGDIIKYTPGGECEIFIEDVGCNGLAVSNDGNLLAACHQSRSVIEFDIGTKEPTTIADSYMGEMLDTPNDLIMHTNGTLYFTNPPNELDGRPQGIGPSLFRIDPEGEISQVAQTNCNGIGLSPDESKLYVLQAGVWDLDEAGVPSNRQNLFTSGDGMAVDCAGNLYVSGTIFSPDGEELGDYSGGTNLAFGGEDGQTLLVVGRGTQVRELRLNLPGYP